jgi:hypothetical protein
VQSELTDHAARVLERMPSRTLDARALYDRVSRDTGIRCGLGPFLDALRSSTHRFALLPAPPPLVDVAGWTESERRRYASALPAAGQTQPLVTLCEPAPVGDALTSATRAGDSLLRAPPAAGTLPPATRAEAAEQTLADELPDVHRSLAELLRGAGHDPGLHAAIGEAMSALTEAAPSGRRGRTRRS